MSNKIEENDIVYLLRAVMNKKVLFTFPDEGLVSEKEAKEYVIENQYKLRKAGIELDVKISDCNIFEPVDVVWDLEDYN